MYHVQRLYDRYRDNQGTHGTSCKEKFSKENFQTLFVVAGGGFLSQWNHQLIKFEEEKKFGLNNPQGINQG